MNARILVVDDELSVREFFEILLSKEGYDVVTALDGKDALRLIREQTFDLIITDLQMKNGDGMTLLRESKKFLTDVPVIMITAFATTDTAVEAMKAGAFDYLSKPFKIEEIKVILKKALMTKNIVAENHALKSELRDKYDFASLLGESEAIATVFQLLKKISPTRTNVLIVGESGTGKELVARAIHFNSPRKDGPIVTVNCGAIPETLIESELFGHEKGSFTGATATKPGLFEAANKGSIFLDEIGELPLPMQVKLLRVIQERSFHRVGGTESIEVDVRLIAATNRNLEEEVKKGNFREDLFYRLNVIQIPLPPLRDRKQDIPLLAEHFLRKYAKETAKDIRRISKEAMDLLMAYTYYGNVRELENIIERSVALETGQAVQPDSLPGNVLHPEQNAPKFSLQEADQKFQQGQLALDVLVDSFEKEWLLKALERSHGSRSRAARLLGISSRSMRYRLKKHGIGGYDDEDDTLIGMDEASESGSRQNLNTLTKTTGAEKGSR
ncbi:MAG: regulator protein pilR [Bacteriovoracaceae bacterium]|nr:regulator protein pilR [Bacteriovoracaceae bacterium]